MVFILKKTVKTIIKRLIQVKSKDKNNNIRLKDLHKEIADKEKQEEHIDDKIDKVLQEMYWFDRKLFNLYRKEFHSIRKLSKATKISHVTVHKTIAKCKQELKNKINALKIKYNIRHVKSFEMTLVRGILKGLKTDFQYNLRILN